MLSRKHYQSIAGIMSNARVWTRFSEEDRRLMLDFVAGKLADYFLKDNPRFDRDRFVAACNGRKEGK